LRDDRDTWLGEIRSQRGTWQGARRTEERGRMAVTKRDEAGHALGERNPLLEMQRRQAQLSTEASRILVDAMGVLARQQADALRAVFDRSGALDAGAEPLPTTFQNYCMRMSLHACLAQMRLALEGVAAVNAAALDLLEGLVLDAGGKAEEALPAERPD
jgi:hypothetical protein